MDRAAVFIGPPRFARRWCGEPAIDDRKPAGNSWHSAKRADILNGRDRYPMVLFSMAQAWRYRASDMRYLLAVLSLFATSGIPFASRAAAQPLAVHATIDRGLAFLVKDALAWKDEHKCVSCHHAGLVVWSMREAKARGHAVDEPVLAELTKWIAEASGDGKTGVPRPAGVPKALNEKAVSLALALGSERRSRRDSQQSV